MLSLAEIGPALYGAWRLAHFDPDGMRYFDRSIAGFWRSFRVAVLVAPLWIIVLAVNFPQIHGEADWLRIVTAETIGYVIAWVAYPLAAFFLTRFVDRQQDYLGFIVALNWASVIQLAVQTPAHVIDSTSLLPGGTGIFLVWATELAALIYEWYITRTALRLSGFGAFGFVVLDYLIGSIVQQVATMEAYLS
jgi:uncharacterized membrane protein